jgi:signal transduction histidine kinase
MFAPFQRLHDRGRGGLGLGLAIARGFVDAVGAGLDVDDTPGGGLTMTVTLPITVQPAAVQPATVRATPMWPGVP